MGPIWVHTRLAWKKVNIPFVLRNLSRAGSLLMPLQPVAMKSSRRRSTNVPLVRNAGANASLLTEAG